MHPAAVQVSALCLGASLGALTTFSRFSAEVVEMLMVQRYALALGTTALHLLGSLGLTVLGMQSASYFIASRA